MLTKIFFANLLYKMIFNLKLLDRKKPIYIFDIDNTIAKTHQHPNFKGKLTKNIASDLKCYNNIKTLILEKYEQGNEIFFFSVRPIKLWAVTFSWLTKFKFKLKFHDLFFFQSPAHKVSIIKFLCNKGFDIYFYDDMSYNHENNKVLIYRHAIDDVKKLKIKYFDYKFLKKFNN